MVKEKLIVIILSIINTLLFSITISYAIWSNPYEESPITFIPLLVALIPIAIGAIIFLILRIKNLKRMKSLKWGNIAVLVSFIFLGVVLINYIDSTAGQIFSNSCGTSCLCRDQCGEPINLTNGCFANCRTHYSRIKYLYWKISDIFRPIEYRSPLKYQSQYEQCIAALNDSKICENILNE